MDLADDACWIELVCCLKVVEWWHVQCGHCTTQFCQSLDHLSNLVADVIICGSPHWPLFLHYFPIANLFCIGLFLCSLFYLSLASQSNCWNYVSYLLFLQQFLDVSAPIFLYNWISFRIPLSALIFTPVFKNNWRHQCPKPCNHVSIFWLKSLERIWVNQHCQPQFRTHTIHSVHTGSIFDHNYDTVHTGSLVVFVAELRWIINFQLPYSPLRFKSSITEFWLILFDLMVFLFWKLIFVFRLTFSSIM